MGARAALVASAPLLVGLVLAALVCYPFAGGRLLLLDFVSGPRQPLLPAAAFGLDGGLTGGVPLAIGFRLLDRLLGQGGWVVPAAVFFPLATTGGGAPGAHRGAPRTPRRLLLRRQPVRVLRLTRASWEFCSATPSSPFAVTALLDAAQEPHRAGLVLPAWAGATVMMSEHFAWILVPVAAAIVLTRPRRLLASLRLGGVALGAAAISAYLVVPPLLAGASPASPLTQLNAVYRTRADPRVGLVVNVAGLYGFFRPGPTEAEGPLRWPAILAALVLMVALGYVAVLRDAARRRDGLAILAAGVAGYFLALGDQGPTGGLFRFAYGHIPGFVYDARAGQVLGPGRPRVCLRVRLGHRMARHRKPPEGCPARAGRRWRLPCPSSIRRTCSAASAARSRPARSRPRGPQPRALPGTLRYSSCRWHEYFPTQFTGQRTIANPAASYFAGTVLASQNPGPGHAFTAEDPEHVFLDNLLGRSEPATAACRTRRPWRKVRRPGEGGRLAGLRGSRSGSRHSAHVLESLAGPLVWPTATETRDARRVRSVDLVDYRVLPGRPGVVALPVPYSQSWTLDSHPAVRLADGQAGIVAPAGGGVVHYTPARSRARSRPSRRLLLSRASHSLFSGESGCVAGLTRVPAAGRAVTSLT